MDWKNSTHPSKEQEIYLHYITYTLGWICTAAWSLSFYPQVYINWKRKSVVGLSFDFVALDTVGFLVFSAYVISLLWIPSIKAENEASHPGTGGSVHVAEAVFSLHALLLVVITSIQCIVYERGGQRVSEWTRIALVVLGIVVMVSLIVPAAASSRSSWTWLNSITVLSYIKVVVTLLKYWPQVLLNYRRKSTEGWSVYNVLLDFGGGWVSLIQMFIDATASGSNNVPSSYQNMVKYWLCVITLVFDSIFLVQHYALYARKPHHYQMLDRRLNGVLESSAEAEENRVAGDDLGERYLSRRSQGNYQESRGAAEEGTESERQNWTSRTQQRPSTNGYRSPPMHHGARGSDSVVVTDINEEIPVGTTSGGLNPSGMNNCIHGPGHPCFHARVSSQQDVSGDISINSPRDNILENSETERSPILNNGVGGNYGTVYSTGAGNTPPDTTAVNPPETLGAGGIPDIFHGRTPDEVERLEREFQDLGIHFYLNRN